MLPTEQKKFSSSKPTEAAAEQHGPPPGFASDIDHGQPPPMPAGLSAAPSLGTLMHALRKSWKLAVPVALAGAFIAAALTWFLVPAQYNSTMIFRIQARPSQFGLENDGDFPAVQKAQVALLKSHDVLLESIQKSRVAELYGVNTNPAEMAKKLTTAFLEGPEMLNVTLSGPHPEAVAAQLNALGEVYPSKTNKTEEARIKQQIIHLERRLSVGQDLADANRTPTLAELLRDKRVELRDAEKAAKLDDIPEQRSKANADRLMQHDAQRSHNAVKVQIEGLKAELESKRAQQRRMTSLSSSDVDVEDVVRTDPEYQEIMRKIGLVKKDIDYTKSITKRSLWTTALAPLRKNLATLDESRKEFLEDHRGKVAAKADRVAREKMRQDIEDLETRLARMTKEERSLWEQYKVLAAKVEEHDAGPKVPAHVLGLRDQVQQFENEQKRIGDQLAALKGSLPVQPRVVCYTEAFVPTEKDLNRPLKFSLASGGFMFACLLGGICLLEARGRRVYSSQEVMNSLGIPVVGTLPRLPSSARSHMADTLTGVDPQYGMIEAVDSIRTMLLHAPRVDGARIVMIASASEGEGKTTLASHLAASLARAWRKTLLIDGDLRNPNQHKQFDLPIEPGLCEALRGEVEFEDAIKPTQISRLWLLTGGKVDAHALQALAQDGVSAIFDWLKDQYDFIVIDSSPVLPVPDALMLGKHADAVLLSVMKDVSRMPAVYQAQQRFESLQIRVLGTVVIGEKTERYGYAVAYGKAASK